MTQQKVILATHTDMDGRGCEILAKVAFGNATPVKTLDYAKVDSWVRETLETDTESFLFITDLGISEELAEYIDSNASHRVLLLDHHKGTKRLSEKYGWIVYDGMRSGTRLLYDYLVHYLPVRVDDDEILARLQAYQAMVAHIDDYDVWIKALAPVCEQWNDLFWMRGGDWFVNRFLIEPSIEFSPDELLLIQVEEARRKAYLDKYGKTDPHWVELSGRGVAFVIAEQYFSELGHYLLEMYGLPVVALVDFKRMKVSLRGDGSVDCDALAKEFGGGGHYSSAGFSINTWLLLQFAAAMAKDKGETK